MKYLLCFFAGIVSVPVGVLFWAYSPLSRGFWLRLQRQIISDTYANDRKAAREGEKNAPQNESR